MAANQQYEEVFEDADVPKETQTIHHIRANSTIMQLNKILGEPSSREALGELRRLLGVPIQLPRRRMESLT